MAKPAEASLPIIWVRGWLCLVYACAKVMTVLANYISLAHLQPRPGGGVTSQLSGHWNAEAGKALKFPPNNTPWHGLVWATLGLTHSNVYVQGPGCASIVKQVFSF